MAALAAWSFAAAAAEKKKTNPVSESKGGRLTLADALARTFRRSPELAAFAHDERATEARVLQAGIRPNPEASLNVENFAGTRGRGPGRYRGDAGIQPAHRTRQQARRARPTTHRRIRALRMEAP